MSWKFSKKEEKKCPMTGRTLKCFINDCCFLCWHNFLLFDLMLIFKFFISATPLIDMYIFEFWTVQLEKITGSREMQSPYRLHIYATRCG